jgi:hypothetical protein
MTDIPFEHFAEALGDFQRQFDSSAVDGVCHLFKNGQERYAFQLPESACKYNCEQLNKDDPDHDWTYTWNPIG